MSAPQLEFYSSIVVLTGSGLSARSGVPVDPDLGQDGDWSSLYPVHMLALQAQPNDCHLALAEWEKRVLERRGQFTLLTHNTDGLHQRAGSQNVVELNGSMHRLRCAECDWNEDRFWELPLPGCPHCGGQTRPDVA
ncbi:MAG: NAD-dependent deacylase, partial [Candidatus Eremiobacteraeota bacterium]|nr:NAD-dependent deacylase [Candidatus Eremiobacteraeota bacterium]